MVLIENIVMNKCRLCHNRPGQHDINSDKKLVKEIYECIKVKVNDKMMDLLPQCVCEECMKTVKDFFLYRQHIRKVDQSLRKILNAKYQGNSNNSREEVFQCPQCPGTFTIQSVFENHIKSHSCNYDPDFCTRIRDQKCRCLKCKQEFTNLSEYANHFCHDTTTEQDNSHEESLQVKTENESSVLQREKNLNLTKNHVENEKLHEECEIKSSELECKVCNQEFSTIQELKVHKKNHKQQYVCPWKDCEKVLNSTYTLKTHQLKHQGKRPFLCVTCGKGFITKNSLTCHEKIHLDVKGYTCKSCNIGFSVRSNLRAHEKKHHEGIRFYCSQCTKEFVSKCSLDRHERIHTGIKEFKCESCPSAFYTNKELLKHQRYHQGLRLHKCDECFKTFFERHHLITHLRSHTGERPYVCQVPNCGKSFMESQKLKRHHNAKHVEILGT